MEIIYGWHMYGFKPQKGSFFFKNNEGESV